MVVSEFWAGTCQIVRRPRMSGRKVSGTSRRFPRHLLNCVFFVGNEREDCKNLNSQTWPGTHRRPSSRHPWPPENGPPQFRRKSSQRTLPY